LLKIRICENRKIKVICKSFVMPSLYILSVLRIRIWDPGSGAFLTPGSGTRDPGWLKKSRFGSGILIWDEHPGSYFRELKETIFGLKYFNSLMRMRMRLRIRDGKNSDPGSGINIPDKHPG
jgi:hypothetical protein